MTKLAHNAIPKKELSQRLTKALDQLETITRDVGDVGDELMIQYLIEIGELDPANVKDFISRKDA
jgi:hypothetical protein